MRLDGDVAAVRRLDAGDAVAMLDLRLRNREFFKPYEPLRDASFFTRQGQSTALADDVARWERGDSYGFAILDRTAGDELAGWVTIANVVRGAWQNATIGYAVDESANGRGLATDAVGLAVRFAFEEAGLHRIQAAVLPVNARSARVLEKNGFRREGHARRYLQIAGVWADHDLYAITREDV
jgi:ribosomal-protein-alanine N-acetyltransferase